MCAYRRVQSMNQNSSEMDGNIFVDELAAVIRLFRLGYTFENQLSDLQINITTERLSSLHIYIFH